ncbi:MAG: DUF4124 domain-containing protein [Burkholderiales bacterium]|nr:DUF4124 domain-containing protein [Burkholderiales bacterium]
MMKFFPTLLILALACSVARADVFKSTDSSGHTVFTDQRTPGSEKVDIPPAPPAPPAATEEPDEEKAKNAPNAEELLNKKREELQQQISAESASLAKSRAALKHAQDLINGDERNSQADIDRTATLQDDIDRHEKNIEDLRKQISNLK